MMPNQQGTRIHLVVYQISALLAAITIQLNPAFGNLHQQQQQQPQLQQQQQQQPQPPPQRSTSIKPNGWSRCDVGTEFHCELEDRCIGLEQRCDFQEQCLDGQDELGCPPERCNFEHDHCYWLDAFSSNLTHDFWRRFSIVSSSAKRSRKTLPGPMRATNTSSSSGSESRLTHLATNRSLGALLTELGSSQPERSKFLFVPMTWPRPAAGNHLWTRRAEIRAPPIGRTSGACQLRFEYALLTTSLPAGVSNASITLKLAASPRRPRAGPSDKNSSIGSERQVVWSHQVAGQALKPSRAEPSSPANTTGGGGGQQQLWTVGVAELGHLQNFELSFEAESSICPTSIGGGGDDFNSDSKHSEAGFNHVEPGPGGRPTGPAGEGQLPHGRNRPINYEFGLLGADIGQDDARLQVKSVRSARPSATSQRMAPAVAADTFEGALVALRWLEFYNCHDWPQIRRQQVRTGTDDNFNYEEDVTNPNPDETLAMGPGESCAKDEFACSSGSCLPNRLLCNFQDDCYSLNGGPSFAWPWPAESLPVSDDESDDLCRNVLGRENFESSVDDPSTRDDPRDSRQMQLFSTSRPEKFWHLTGNWPIGGVSIGSSSLSNDTQRRRRPARDHTLRSARGNFLSLEVPPSSSGAGSVTYWASITSHWMQKLGADECRLKFFLNFISPLLHRRSILSPAPDALKLIIALEHVTLLNNDLKLQRQRQQWPFGRQQLKLERTVDTMLHSGLEFDTSQLATYNRSHSSIELVGLDFWRKANLEVVNLMAGDFFQLRLVILAQVQNPPGLNGDEPLGSVNIDDLATHFGCGPVEDGHQLEHLSNMALPFWQSAVPRLSDYVKPHRLNRTGRQPQLPPLKNKWGRFKTPAADEADCYDDELSARGSSSQFLNDDKHHKLRHRLEQVPPQLLVAYVFCAFCLIIGLIGMIVFVMVPHVERAMMQHQNQIQLSLSGEISDVPATTSHSTTSDFLSISPSGSMRTATLFGGALDHLDYETHFSGARDEHVISDQFH